MIPVNPLDRAISNIKYRLGKYYVRMGLTETRTRKPGGTLLNTDNTASDNKAYET